MSRENRLYLAWVVGLVATLGSLYFSEVRGFNPCILCWYQRICMYPQVLLLGIAAFRSDLNIRRYSLPLAAICALIALYQNLETWGVVPTLKACVVNVQASCGTPWPVWGLQNETLNHVLSIPVLSMIASVLIVALLSWRRVPVAQASAGVSAEA